jgi:hypothetical protein
MEKERVAADEQITLKKKKAEDERKPKKKKSRLHTHTNVVGTASLSHLTTHAHSPYFVMQHRYKGKREKHTRKAQQSRRYKKKEQEV